MAGEGLGQEGWLDRPVGERVEARVGALQAKGGLGYLGEEEEGKSLAKADGLARQGGVLAGRGEYHTAGPLYSRFMHHPPNPRQKHQAGGPSRHYLPPLPAPPTCRLPCQVTIPGHQGIQIQFHI